MTLISDEYRKQQSAMHDIYDDYGVAHRKHVRAIAKMVGMNGFTSLLDYGAGKCGLTRELARLAREEDVMDGLGITSYDPGVEKLSAMPDPAEFVVCIDVLEHVEPDYTENVLRHIQNLTTKLCYLSIALTPAAKTLPDGRNAHINLRPSNEWVALMLPLFTVRSVHSVPNNVVIIGERK